MQSWIPEIWQAAVIGLVVGVILGYLLLRLTKGSVKKQVQTEAELKEVKTQLSDKQAQLEKHFAESAELFKTLIGDYQKLYRHYAVDHILKNLVYTAAIITISTFQSGSASFASTVARLGGFWLSTHSSHAWLS